MALFPLFVNLENRKCIVVGGGNVASRKVKTLVDFQAEIIVISPLIQKSILDLQMEGLVTCVFKEYTSEDLEAAYLVVAATSDKAINSEIASDAMKRNIHVNVVDSPELCTFSFPAIARKSDVVVGVTSSKKFPLLSKLIKNKIVDIFDEIDEEALKHLEKRRIDIIAENPDPIKRKELMIEALNEIWKHEEQR